MFRVWVTKHVSYFCGTNRQLSRMDPSVANVCPCCGAMDETTSHIVRCPSQGRTCLCHNSVSDLVEWLEEVDTDPFLSLSYIQTFLLGRGELTTISLPYDAPPKFELVCVNKCVFMALITLSRVEYHQFWSTSNVNILLGIWLGSASLEPHTSAMAI